MQDMAMPIVSLILLAIAPDPACDLRAITTAKSVHDVLSRRAVEIVSLAGQPGAESSARLEALISPSAPFTLGAGDVGRPFGSGRRGAAAMARAMNADSYRFPGWDNLDSPTDACADRQVTVEFSNGRLGRQAKIVFAFSNGRLASATGWEQSFEAGPLPRKGGLMRGALSDAAREASSVDLVLVGKATSDVRTEADPQGVVHGFTRVIVERLINGAEPAKEIWIETHVNLSGFDYRCCEAGRRYIFFLNAKGDDYVPDRYHDIIEL